MMDTSIRQKFHYMLQVDRAVRLVWESGPGLTVVNILLIVIQGALPLLSLYLMKLIVDSVTAGLTAPDPAAAFKQTALFIVLAAATVLFGSLLQAVSSLVNEAQSQRLTDHVQSLIHAKSIELDLAYYENSAYYDSLHRAQREGAYRPAKIVSGLANLAQNTISLIAMIGLLVSFSKGIAAVLFLAAVPGILVKMKHSDTLYRWQRGRTTTERFADFYNWMITGIQFAKEIRLFNLGRLFSKRFADLRKLLRVERIQLSRRRAFAELGAQAGGTVAVFAAFAYIARHTINGLISLGDMVMYYQAFQRGLNNLRQLLAGLAGLYEDNLFLSNLYEFLEQKPGVVEPEKPVPISQSLRSGIVFEGVRFRYPGSEREVLKGVDLRLNPGEVVALVGENGSGKTTLAKLLCRLYDPTEGQILLDGVELRDFPLIDLRREISVIFQDYARYPLTARENIWFGDTARPVDDSGIQDAARKTGVDEAIAALPRGYDTILGKWFEGGEELSIGEWQKLALARAFLRDTQIVVLDEPTSAMDAIAEAEVFTSFKKVLEGRTALLISHRFSTVRMADRIYVLTEGKITESGTHKDLMLIGGTYSKMYTSQARNYSDA